MRSSNPPHERAGQAAGRRYAVLGAGSWGTALARHLAAAGRPVTLWSRDAGRAEEIWRSRENPDYLPGFILSSDVAVTGDLAEAVAGAARIIIAVPSHGFRDTLRIASPLLERDAALVLTAKGIENDTLALMTTIASEEAGDHPAAVLSGPSFALEVARGDPTAVVIASEDAALAKRLQQEISHGGLRLYTNGDPVGVQLAGALKNVFAIASGVISGVGYGSNTLAAMITRSLAEMRRLGVAAGGRTETFDGLAGLGDLVLTCTGALSRNRRLGETLGRGGALAEALAETTQVAEGVRTSIAARDLALEHSVEMPIVEQVYAVLHRGRPTAEAIDELMSRRLRGEEES